MSRGRELAERVLTQRLVQTGDQDVTNNTGGQVGVFNGDLADLRPVFNLLGRRAVLDAALALSTFDKGRTRFGLTARSLGLSWNKAVTTSSD